jgi:pimeloyl-ACP methyl ester carboxylesterase
MTRSDLVSEANASVEHVMFDLDGVDVFYRRGRKGDPVILLPHGYPSSSFQFRYVC